MHLVSWHCVNQHASEILCKLSSLFMLVRKVNKSIDHLKRNAHSIFPLFPENRKSIQTFNSGFVF